MEAAEAVAKVEDWLRAVSTSGEPTARADHSGVRRVPEGWSVPYNSIAYLDHGQTEKQLFPPPVLIVREPEGDLRHAAAHPGGVSVPVTYPGQETWQEIVDPEYLATGLGDLGVPLKAVGGWQKVGADGTPTGEERDNPEYKVGPLRRGYPLPENQLESLLLCYAVGWLDRERFLVGLTWSEVYVPLDLESGKASRYYWNESRKELKVFTATRRLPPREHAWWKVDVTTLAQHSPVPNLVIVGGPATYEEVRGEELTESLAKFPRYAPPVDVSGRCPEAEEELVRLAADTAARLGLDQPVRPPLHAAEKARKRGFELTGEECQKLVIGQTWLTRLHKADPPPGRPNDLRANGLAASYDNQGRVVPRLDTFGKFFEIDLPGFRYGWERVTGAFVGWAVGEALGSAVDRMSLDEIRARFGPKGLTDYGIAFERTGQIGSLTQRLLFATETVIRSPHRENHQAEDRFPAVVRSGFKRWLHTQGFPYDQADGWLVKVPELNSRRNPEPQELLAVQAASDGLPDPKIFGPTALLASLPAALTVGGPNSGLAGGSRTAVLQLAGATHSDPVDLETAIYLARLFEEALTSQDFSFPMWSTTREVFNENDPTQQNPVWPQLLAMVDQAVPYFREHGLPEPCVPEDIGDGQSTMSVLGRALAALSGFENYPERALLRAINHSGRSALTGAIAGALLGARTGIPGLPQKWVEELELRYLVENLATDAFWHFDRHSALGTEGQHWVERYPRW